MIREFISNNKKYFLFALIIIIALFIDQIIKRIIVNNIDEGEKIEIIKNFFYITLSYNKAAGFGLFDFEEPFRTIFFSIVTLIALGVYIYLLFKYSDTKKNKIFIIAMTLIISGAIGNFIDRLFVTEGVIDFLQFYLLGRTHGYVSNINPFPTFNIADSYLTIGMIILFIDILFGNSGKMFDGNKRKESKIIEEKVN